MNDARAHCSDCKRARTGSEKVELGVCGENPEAVILPSERLHIGPLAHVPDSDVLVLGNGKDELMLGVEEGGRYAAGERKGQDGLFSDLAC
jgi:hypothetical protein